MQGKTKNKRILILVIMVVLIEPWIICILHCEVLTYRYASNEIIQTINEYIGEDDLDQIKLLEFKDLSYCIVYAKNDNSGHKFILLYNMHNDIHKWRVVYWETVWSKSGSADEYIWPYLR